jgi:Sterol-sensing domain of SREBP cleavage-activation
MNAVLAYPPQMSTTLRIANALGDVGHLSMAATFQNLAILWLLYKVVSPGVQAFCIFAAAALIFDFFFHLIFFVAVLSVDVRRVELQDSMDRVKENGSMSKRTRKLRQYWFDALMQGRLPFSSRIAFPAVSICFILGLNIQFSDSDSLARLLIQGLMSLRRQLDRSPSDSEPVFAPSINQARTPKSWLRLQNHQTAQEVIKFVKPSAHAIIARIYDPIAIVLRGSDRSQMASSSITTRFVLEKLNGHIYPFLLTIVFTAGVVTLLMQYLLWNEIIEEAEEVSSSKSGLKINRLPHSHDLDIFRLAVSAKAHIVAVDYSRRTAVYTFSSTTQTWSVDPVPTTCLPLQFWPNNSLAIDDSGAYAALANNEGWVAIWDMQQRRLTHLQQLSPWNPRSCLFQLVSIDTASSEKITLVVLSPEGQLKMLGLQDKIEINYNVEHGLISYAKLMRTSRGIFIIMLTQQGTLLNLPLSNDNLSVHRLDEKDVRLSSRQDQPVKYLTTTSSLSAIAVVRQETVDLIDLSTSLLIHTLSLSAAPKSIRIFHSLSRICRTCHSVAVHTLSIAYTDRTTKDCIMKTFTSSADNSNALICLRPSTNMDSSSSCYGIRTVPVAEYRVADPGQWEATNEQSLVGIRSSCIKGSGNATNDSATPYISISTSRHLSNSIASLRPRTFRAREDSKPTRAQNEWEVWTLSSTGAFSSMSVAMDATTDLFVAQPGPLAPLGKRSVAVVLGNGIRVVTVGGERIEEVVRDVGVEKGHGRRRKGGR